MAPRHTLALTMNATFQDLHGGFSGRVSSNQSEQRQPAVVAPEPLYFEVSCGSAVFVRMYLVETTVIAIIVCFFFYLFDRCCLVLTFMPPIQDTEELPGLANGGAAVQRCAKPDPNPAQTNAQPKIPKNLVREVVGKWSTIGSS